MLSKLGEELFRSVVVHSRVNDDVISRYPVYRRGDFVLVSELKRVDNTNNFIKVATSRSRVGNQKSDSFLRVDNEDCSDLYGFC